MRQPGPRSTPYSDAYMSGQPSKRRRLNKEKKPRGEVRDVIADSLQVIPHRKKVGIFSCRAADPD